MKWVLVTFVLASCVLATTYSLRGQRIIGGQEVTRGEYPWVTLVEAFSKGQVVSYCGGALISKDYILTAAQCLTGCDKVRVWLGAHNISNPNEFSRVRLNATIFHKHPNFTDTFYDNDIGIVQLPKSVSPSAYIDYAFLPTPEQAQLNIEGMYGSVLGWGFISQTYNKMHDVLMLTSNRVTTPSTCETKYGAGWMTPNKYCVETAGGRGPCFGDAGGPFMANNEDGSALVFGIFSFLDTDSCYTGIPVGFTKVGAYLDWIKATTGL